MACPSKIAHKMKVWKKKHSSPGAPCTPGDPRPLGPGIPMGPGGPARKKNTQKKS